MRILALDVGKVRIGFAISNEQETIATPLAVLPSEEVFGTAPSFKRILEDWEVEHLLFGLPRTMGGELGPQAVAIKDVADGIACATGLPHTFADERLSSKEAKNSLKASGLSEKEMRGKVDMVAATLFLQAWLDERRKQKEHKQQMNA